MVDRSMDVGMCRSCIPGEEQESRMAHPLLIPPIQEENRLKIPWLALLMASYEAGFDHGDEGMPSDDAIVRRSRQGTTAPPV